MCGRCEMVNCCTCQWHTCASRPCWESRLGLRALCARAAARQAGGTCMQAHVYYISDVGPYSYGVRASPGRTMLEQARSTRVAAVRRAACCISGTASFTGRWCCPPGQRLGAAAVMRVRCALKPAMQQLQCSTQNAAQISGQDEVCHPAVWLCWGLQNPPRDWSNDSRVTWKLARRKEGAKMSANALQGRGRSKDR